MFDKTASNPASHIAQAIALFSRRAPDVALNLHVGTLTAIERGVLDGQCQWHRPAWQLGRAGIRELFDETMLCAAEPRTRCLTPKSRHSPRIGKVCAATLLPVWATKPPIWK